MTKTVPKSNFWTLEKIFWEENLLKIKRDAFNKRA